ncbi:hypothetical protein [Archangium lansingense]|uniref:DUF4280 domain-containing protein n=1 Tax=Archangium lansingense TaxID=2995310 RepID=A0ABT4AAL5_9BACT|nr:hypothetical protein [Archangium lansinium]MCY1078704.1 hypothetical protein [Archangium lansinium]
MGALLNTSSTLQCPHGGQVQVMSSNTRAKAGGSFLVRASDTFTIAGCVFAPGGVPHPCMSVKWVSTALRGTVLGDALLTMDSVGLCLAADNAPQGTVLILSTQQRASGT